MHFSLDIRIILCNTVFVIREEFTNGIYESRKEKRIISRNQRGS